MKLIIDTNILFSALYDSDPHAGRLILLAAERKVDLLAPESVGRELEHNMMKKLEYSKKEAREIIAVLPVMWLDERIYSPALEIARHYLAHEADVSVLASSFSTDHEIVSGDKHLLSIERKVVKVWKLTQLMKRLHRDLLKGTSS